MTPDETELRLLPVRSKPVPKPAAAPRPAAGVVIRGAFTRPPEGWAAFFAGPITPAEPGAERPPDTRDQKG